MVSGLVVYERTQIGGFGFSEQAPISSFELWTPYLDKEPVCAHVRPARFAG